MEDWLDQLLLEPWERILEFNCGTGDLTWSLVRQLDHRGLIVGLDQDPKKIQVALARQPRQDMLRSNSNSGIIFLVMESHYLAVRSEWKEYFHRILIHHHDSITPEILAACFSLLVSSGQLTVSSEVPWDSASYVLFGEIGYENISLVNKTNLTMKKP